MSLVVKFHDSIGTKALGNEDSIFGSSKGNKKGRIEVDGVFIAAERSVGFIDQFFYKQIQAIDAATGRDAIFFVNISSLEKRGATSDGYQALAQIYSSFVCQDVGARIRREVSAKLFGDQFGFAVILDVFRGVHDLRQTHRTFSERSACFICRAIHNDTENPYLLKIDGCRDKVFILPGKKAYFLWADEVDHGGFKTLHNANLYPAPASQTPILGAIVDISRVAKYHKVSEENIRRQHQRELQIIKLLESSQSPHIFHPELAIEIGDCGLHIMEQALPFKNHFRSICQKPLRERLEFARQMLCGLEAVHKLGLIHRDVKPDNFLISRDKKRVMITDFGRAAPVGDAAYQGVFYHTRPTDYSPPDWEYWPERAATQGGDLWTMGVVFHELLLGKRVPWKVDRTHSPYFFDAKYWDDLSDEKGIVTLIYHMMRSSVSKRYTATQCRLVIEDFQRQLRSP